MYFQLNTIQNTVNSKAQSLPLKKTDTIRLERPMIPDEMFS